MARVRLALAAGALALATCALAFDGGPDLQEFLSKRSPAEYAPDGKCRAASLRWEEDGFQVRASLYRGRGPSGRAILIVPPTGGTNPLDRSYAWIFCRHGFDAYILDRWSGDDEYSLDLGIHNRLYTRGQRAIELTRRHTRVRLKTKSPSSLVEWFC